MKKQVKKVQKLFTQILSLQPLVKKLNIDKNDKEAILQNYQRIEQIGLCYYDINNVEKANSALNPSKFYNILLKTYNETKRLTKELKNRGYDFLPVHNLSKELNNMLIRFTKYAN